MPVASNWGNPMRENLLDYLLGAVEPEERSAVEQNLAQDARLRDDLDLLRTSLAPLGGEPTHHEPPKGLAQRCCEFVFSRDIMPARLSPASGSETLRPRHRWSRLDLAIGGAIAAAVAILILPAIYQSRLQSQITACQNNLKDIGLAMSDYSDRHRGYYPAVRPGDRLNAVGMWAPVLEDEDRPLRGPAIFCPSSDVDANFRMPHVKELDGMTGAQFAAIAPRLGGSYGYTMGYRDGESYKTPQNQHRKNYALISDAPGPGGTNSLNHGGSGQNVLYDDDHVWFQNGTQIGPDDIFHNERGEIGPGAHSNDAVIVHSEERAMDSAGR
jgi:hypothetical protein